MHLVDTCGPTSQTPASHRQQHTTTASSGHSETSGSVRRRGRRGASSDGKERREKGKGQGSQSQRGGVKRPGKVKKTRLATADGGHGKAKGRAKSVQGIDAAEKCMEQS